jgi:hypothetical protein
LQFVHFIVICPSVSCCSSHVFHLALSSWQNCRKVCFFVSCTLYVRI